MSPVSPRSPLLIALGRSVARPVRARQQTCLRAQCPLAGMTTRHITTHPYAHHAATISVLPTSVDRSSPEFLENSEKTAAAIASLKDLHTNIERGGPKKARDKHLARGKMLPRDRVTTLIDPGTSFLELSPLAGHEVYPNEDVPAGGIITGLGVIEGVTCIVVANDSTYDCPPQPPT
ncbi:hypothetical protein FGG08_005769 [Glutinoglossum americanum]|uniref:Acetyl-coenzyme A carboxylase carboxyl transferase subunit beta domain-containing protein n=1 Tax=Glutinoglossum americanum TaxID=1670608 RepID=A0A9P8HTW6_9PEZI|nr:hypothetical protein FGG08_005769 [Glutinoglossum americanum]